MIRWLQEFLSHFRMSFLPKHFQGNASCDIRSGTLTILGVRSEVPQWNELQMERYVQTVATRREPDALSTELYETIWL